MSGTSALSMSALFVLMGCGTDQTTLSNGGDAVIEALLSVNAPRCECESAPGGTYPSEETCLDALTSGKGQAWVDCANTLGESSSADAVALSCYASALLNASSCVAETTCTPSPTYALDTAACVSASTSQCPTWDATEARINACVADSSTGSNTFETSGMLGSLCLQDSDCISGFCLESEYGAPFCSRACDDVQVDCPAGDDAGPGASLCVSFADDNLPFPELVDSFEGEAQTFCVPRCTDQQACLALNASWEVCEQPKYKGNTLYPGLGTGVKVCQSPSHHGKDPVNPQLCDWEKTIGNFGTEASVCTFYCQYLSTCLVLDVDADLNCCEWGCFSRMVINDERNDAWHDVAKCYIDDHAAWPAVGVDNKCSHPPKACGGEPDNPTHPAAAP